MQAAARIGIVDSFFEGRTQLIFMCKGKIHVVRPAGVAGNEQRMKPTVFQLFLQQRQRLHRQLVILCQRRNKAVAAVRTKPEGIAGKEIFPIRKVYHMPPCMTGNQETLDLDAVNFKDLSIVKQPFFVADGHLRQHIEMIEDLAVCFSGQIPVFDLADVQLCILKQSRTVRFYRAHMVGTLMGDEDVPDGIRMEYGSIPSQFIFSASRS